MGNVGLTFRVDHSVGADQGDMKSQKMNHVHIVGLAPRSGTTLLMELMVSCFDFDGYADHELGLIYQPAEKVESYCSKNPVLKDIRLAPLAFRRWPELWIICVVRDPRDIVVSRHRQHPDVYWVNLNRVFGCMPLLRTANQHERFLIIQYEDLVKDPNSIQSHLSKKIPFLRKLYDFSEFSQIAKPTSRAVEALGGMRAVSPSSIGRWKNELPRLKAQIQRYGEIDELLSELGYENDNCWRRMLDSVDADNGLSRFGDLPRRRTTLRNYVRRHYHDLRFYAGFPKERPIIVTKRIT